MKHILRLNPPKNMENEDKDIGKYGSNSTTEDLPHTFHDSDGPHLDKRARKKVCEGIILRIITFYMGNIFRANCLPENWFDSLFQPARSRGCQLGCPPACQRFSRLSTPLDDI